MTGRRSNHPGVVTPGATSIVWYQWGWAATRARASSVTRASLAFGLLCGGGRPAAAQAQERSLDQQVAGRGDHETHRRRGQGERREPVHVERLDDRDVPDVEAVGRH